MRAYRLFSRFHSDQRASVVPTFVLALIPILSFMGVAVDYSRANSLKSALQAALDATALMLTKEAATLPAGSLPQKANSYLAALLNRPEAHNVSLTTSLTQLSSGSYQLDLSGNAIVDTTFTHLLGQAQMAVSATAQVVWGYRKLELALALDNTGSMAQSGKIQALRTASHNLINILKDASKSPGSIKIAVIPFDTTVKIATSYKAQPWFDWSTLDCNGWQLGTGCGSHPEDQWAGCLEDRTQPYDVQDTPPSSTNSATLFPATACGSLAAAMPLSYDWTALHDKVDAMNPNGNTNVTIGLIWALHALTVNTPFIEAASAAPDLDKVIILLTDGTNTQNRWSSSESQINARTSAACTNIKAAGIKIYAVRVINGNASLLSNCATNPAMYYDVDQASELDGVFQAIANSLANVRLAK